MFLVCNKEIWNKYRKTNCAETQSYLSGLTVQKSIYFYLFYVFFLFLHPPARLVLVRINPTCLQEMNEFPAHSALHIFHFKDIET